MITELISPYLISIFAAWFGAHLIKYIISSIKKEKLNLRAHLFISGGMPSAHSSAVTAMVIIIGLRDGIELGLFGIAVLFAAITMYDAVKVRRSSGEQGVAIRYLIRENKSNVVLPRVAKGHTPLEVIFGVILGVVIGIVVFMSTK